MSNSRSVGATRAVNMSQAWSGQGVRGHSPQRVGEKKKKEKKGDVPGGGDGGARRRGGA